MKRPCGKKRTPLRTFTALALLMAHLTACNAGEPADDALRQVSRAGDSKPENALQTSSEITIDLSSNLFSFGDNITAQPVKDTTVLVYMVGTNLETEHYAASADLYEIAASGLDPERTNVVICTGGTRGWRLDIPSNVNTILRMRGADDIGIDAASEKLANMGEAQTLVDFLNFSAAAYPASHYALIFWDHGLGPVQGFGYDEMYEDVLDVSELKAALSTSVFSGEKHLDWVGFDACLMATVEIASVLSPFTDYLIASQEAESGYGWDFSFLSSYNDTTDPLVIADAVLTSYEDFFAENRTPYFNPDVTLSCMDLSALGAVKDAMDGLFSTMLKDLTGTAYNRHAKIRASAKSFGVAAAGGTSDSLDLIDLKDYADRMQVRFPDEGHALAKALDAFIVRQVSNVDGAHGVSMYHPFYNEVLYTFFGLEPYADYDLPESVTAYLEAFCAYWTGQKDTDEDGVDYAAVFAEMDRGTATQTEVMLRLTPEQIESAERVYYTVFLEYEEDVYTPVVASLRTEPDGDGIVHIDCEQALFSAVTDMEDGIVWPVVLIENGDKRRLFQTVNAQMHNTYEFYPWGDSDNYTVTFEESMADGAITVTEVEKVADDFEIDSMVIHNGKTTVDVGNWDYIAYSYFRYVPAFDEDGRTLPFTLWETDGYGFTNFLALDRTFHFEKTALSGQQYRAYCQILVRDASDALHASDLLPLYNPSVPDLASVATPAGSMTFELYDDHAELAAYEGTDTEITIPALVSGKEVTGIGSNVFYRCDTLERVTMPDTVTWMGYGVFCQCTSLTDVHLSAALEKLPTDAFCRCTSLTEITLPEGLATIGVYALAHTALEKIELPASLTDIRPGAFADNDLLTEIVPADETLYRVKDGVLFSADGTVLVAYPAGLSEDHYAIPAGTKEIMDYAFVGTENLAAVTYPDSLLEIGEFAFYDTFELADAYEFPDALTRIGAGAFYQVLSNQAESIGRIHIGKNITEIGKDAFGDRHFAVFDVDTENPYYADRGGALTNKAGDYLLYVPSDISGTYTIPEGVAVVDDHAFPVSSDIEELIVPDSVLYLGGFSLPGKKYHIGAGLIEWRGVSGTSYEEITIDEDNAYYMEEDQVIYNKDRTVIYNYPYRSEEEVFAIPEGVTAIAQNAGLYCRNLTRLILPSTLTEGVISRYGMNTLGGFDYLEAYEVDAKNEAYQAVDGILYTKDGRTLIAIPPESGERIVIMDGVTTVCTRALPRLQHSAEIVFPEGVTYLGNFLSGIYQPSTLEEMHVDIYVPASVTEIHASLFNAESRSIRSGGTSVVTIHCPAGSYADTFFREKDLPVVND